MSSFLVNHPISDTLLINAALCGIGVTLFVGFTTLRDILQVPRTLWPAAGRSRRAWIITGWVALLLFPLGWVAAIYWWGRVRRQLESHRPPETYFPFGPLGTLFSDESSLSLWIGRSALGFFAVVGLVVGAPAFGQWAVGDPTTIYDVGSPSRTVDPRLYIRDNCPISVRRVLHLGSNDVELDGHSYQRWSVVPLPGHLDEVLFDTDSGHVICP
jgi:hypothetical protein